MRRRLYLTTLGISALLFLGVLAAFLLREPSGATRKLKDGSTVTLLQITSGTNHVYVEGNILQRTAARFLSPALLKNLNITRIAVPSGLGAWGPSTTNQFIWVRFDGPMTMPPAAGGRCYYSAVVLDEAQGEIRSGLSSTINTPRGAVSLFQLVTLPTGSRTLKAQIRRHAVQPGGALTSRDTETLTEFDVPNPVFIQHPKWRAASLPANIAADDFDFTVLKVGPPEPGGQTMQFGRDWRPSHIYAQLKPRSGSTNRWEIQELRILNEAGAEHQMPLAGSGASGGHFQYPFNGTLSTNSLYKLRFTLRASSDGRTDTHTFYNVPLPAGSTNAFTPMSATVGGFTVAITDMNAKGDLRATLQPKDPQRRLRCVKAAWPSGVAGYPPSERSATADHYFGKLVNLSGSTNVDLTFEWRLERDLEVIVRPEAAEDRLGFTPVR